MGINTLFAAPLHLWDSYQGPLAQAFAKAGLAVALSPDHPAATVDYIIHGPGGGITEFSAFTRAKAVLNLWAGVEAITGNPTLTIPLARMVDTGLTQGMREWVCGHVLRHHLGMDAHILGQDGQWRKTLPPLAPARPVTILGLGELGRACATSLANLGFAVTGWSRTAHNLPGIRCLHGDHGLSEALSGAQIVVTLMPLTPQTENLLNAARLALLAPGAALINPGRGALIDDTALIDALDSGHLGHATLDVFRTEPLPPDHPFWAHPHVTVTPHIAAETRPESAAAVIAENIRRGEAGEPLMHLVDRTRGY